MFAPAVSTAVVGEEFGERFCCGVSASELKPVQVPATRLAALWLVPEPLARSTLRVPFAGDQLAPGLGPERQRYDLALAADGVERLDHLTEVDHRGVGVRGGAAELQRQTEPRHGRDARDLRHRDRGRRAADGEETIRRVGDGAGNCREAGAAL